MVRYDHPLHGGCASLDFVNTVDPREPAGEDFLPDYDSLLAWARTVRLLGPRELTRIGERAQASPRKAADAHRRAIELREALYPVLLAHASGDAPPHACAEWLARAAECGRRLRWSGGEWRWEPAAVDPLERPAQAVLEDALDLLTGGGRVARCEGERCGWLFVDTSKNHSRRWCSMGGCGNRAKARRHYDRRRALVR